MLIIGVIERLALVQIIHCFRQVELEGESQAVVTGVGEQYNRLLLERKGGKFKKRMYRRREEYKGEYSLEGETLPGGTSFGRMNARKQ